MQWNTFFFVLIYSRTGKLLIKVFFYGAIIMLTIKLVDGSIETESKALQAKQLYRQSPGNNRNR